MDEGRDRIEGCVGALPFIGASSIYDADRVYSFALPLLALARDAFKEVVREDF